MIARDYYNEEETRMINKIFRKSRDEYVKSQLKIKPDLSEADFFGTEPYHLMNKIFNKSRKRIEIYEIVKAKKELK